MNVVHRRYCRSPRWRHHLHDLLPWATEGVPLEGSVLELGSGPGLTTDWLRTRTRSLSAVELDETDAGRLAARLPDVDVRQADARALPFPDDSFDVVVCFTMLHHVPTAEMQNRLFAEARRVLRPGGVFAGSDSRWGPLFAVAHVGDTMRLIDPADLPGRLRQTGFQHVRVDLQRHALRFCATA